LPDDRKYFVGPLYLLAGGAAGPEEIVALFKDFEGTRKRNIAATFGTLSDQPRGIAEALFGVGLLTEDREPPAEEALIATAELGRDMIGANPRAAAGILAAVVAFAAEQDMAADHADRALHAMATGQCEQAAWYLGELGRWPAMGPLGAKARSLAARMEAAGIRPAHPLASRFSHGIATGIDGAGSRSVLLFFRAEEDELDAACVLLNDAVGVKDAWCSFGEGEEIEAHFRAQPEITHGPCSLPLAREFLAEAWAAHERLATPFPARLLLCRPYFGPEPIAPQSRTPDLHAYGLDRKKHSPSLVDASDELIDHPGYGGFSFTSDAAYGFVSEHSRRRGVGLSKEKAEDFLRNVAVLERDLLLGRMATNLEIEALGGRAASRANRMAANTWRALRDDLIPFHEVPYVRALCSLSIEMISHNLLLGFHSQAEADQAGLLFDEGEDNEDEESPDGLFDDLFE
jgi:hypothetical protein